MGESIELEQTLDIFDPELSESNSSNLQAQPNNESESTAPELTSNRSVLTDILASQYKFFSFANKLRTENFIANIAEILHCDSRLAGDFFVEVDHKINFLIFIILSCFAQFLIHLTTTNVPVYLRWLFHF